MLQLPHIQDIDVRDRSVFLRCDLNVPLRPKNGDGPLVIADDTRIRASLHTIHWLLQNGASVYVASHLGRPKGEIKPKFSLSPVAKYFEQLLCMPVPLLEDWMHADFKPFFNQLESGQMAVLENSRFWPEETNGDEQTAQRIADNIHIYCNDAFGTAHRAHLTTEAIAAFTSHGYAGFLMHRELQMLDSLMQEDVRGPFVVVLGGGPKVDEKLPIIEFLASRAHTFILGGIAGQVFLKTKYDNIGDLGIENQDEVLCKAAQILDDQDRYGYKIELPRDIQVAKDENSDSCEIASDMEVGGNSQVFDIGSETRNIYAQILAKAGTVLWNGPMGCFENYRYGGGTLAVARAIALGDSYSVAGGGETMQAINRFGLTPCFDHVSTGGGASLEYLSGKKLPGVEVLTQK
ncbi:phosphoglycerate kinase [Patescibacteria group bacterium]